MLNTSLLTKVSPSSSSQTLALILVQGYPNTRFTIRPFSDNDLTNNAVKTQQRKDFNVHLSSARQIVEHAIGQLKGRFGILRSMPGYNMDGILNHIESMFVFHNILKELGDDPEAIHGYNGQEDVDVRQVIDGQYAAVDDRAQRSMNRDVIAGTICRKVLMELMLYQV
jgi:hypothetical protein